MTTSRNILHNTVICEVPFLSTVIRDFFFFCPTSFISLMWIIPELSFSQPVLSLLIDSLKNAIRRAKAEINIIYWGKLPSGQRNLKPLCFCPIANAWQMIAMYLQGYRLLQGSDNLLPERVFVPSSHGRWIQMTQSQRQDLCTGEWKFSIKLFIFLNCWYSTSKLAWHANTESSCKMAITLRRSRDNN